MNRMRKKVLPRMRDLSQRIQSARTVWLLSLFLLSAQRRMELGQLAADVFLVRYA